MFLLFPLKLYFYYLLLDTRSYWIIMKLFTLLLGHFIIGKLNFNYLLWIKYILCYFQKKINIFGKLIYLHYKFKLFIIDKIDIMLFPKKKDFMC